MIALLVLSLGVAPLVAATNTDSSQPTASQQQGSMQQASSVHWYTNYNQAAAQAQKEKKPLLLFFTGTDWCGWCKKMDQEIFSSPDFAKAAGNEFVFVELDYPMNKKLPQDEAQQNASLKQKFGITGYPTVVILDPNGNFIAESGYRPGGGKAYADYLKQLVQ